MQKYVRIALAAVAGVILPASVNLVYAVPVNADINVAGSLVYNDRIGNSRFFFGANSDLIRISTFLTPSPDSDAAGATLNGAKTTVSISHPVFGGLALSAPFSGLTSGIGGSVNEYQRPLVRSLLSEPDLDALDTIRSVFTVTNPDAPGAKSVSFNAPDFDRNALPGFVRDMKVTVGLTPTLEWSLPAAGVAATAQTIQIRRIDAESADRSRITSATLISIIDVPVTSTNATIPDGILQVGQRYEIAVQQDLVSGSALTGRSRSFFEFAPLPAGSGEVTVFLPSIGPDGKFKFDIGVEVGKKIALDPIAAIGYDYQIGEGDPLFASVELPDIGDGLFDLYLFSGTDWIFDRALSAGEEFSFAGSGVDRFRILGIEEDAALDPLDTTAFITNVTFAGNGRFTGTMTPITSTISSPVPEAATLAIFSLGLISMFISRRRIYPQPNSMAFES
jgi:hypothetical protein